MHVQVILARAKRAMKSQQSLLGLFIVLFIVDYDHLRFVFQKNLICHILHMFQNHNMFFSELVDGLNVIFGAHDQMLNSLLRNVLENCNCFILVQKSLLVCDNLAEFANLEHRVPLYTLDRHFNIELILVIGFNSPANNSQCSQ